MLQEGLNLQKDGLLSMKLKVIAFKSTCATSHFNEMLLFNSIKVFILLFPILHSNS